MLSKKSFEISIANVWATNAVNPLKTERAAVSISVERLRVVLFGELNDFVLRDEVRASRTRFALSLLSRMRIRPADCKQP